jgi:hypothetical protein
MDFQTKPQEEVYKKVEGYLRELFGEMVKKPAERPVFLLRRGSTIIHIAIAPWGEDEAVVVVRAYVNFGADLVRDLLEFLVKQNSKMRFGAFGADDDGDIFFEHTIVGSTCDKKEIKASVLAVGSTADDYDEQIMRRWGGLRQEDRIKEVL